MSPETQQMVRVPWVMGTTAAARPRTPRPRPSRGECCTGKVAAILEDLEALEYLRGSCLKAGDERRREDIERELAFQKRRIEWLAAAAGASDETLAERARVLEDELGEEGLAYLAGGLPRAFAKDQRFTDQLGELAILRFALQAHPEER